VAKVRELEIFRYETPIRLEFANQSKGKAYLWADFGKILGEVALIPQCSSTLISTIKLARRGISFMMGEGFLQLLDRNQKVIYHQDSKDNGDIPKVEINSISDLDAEEYDIGPPDRLVSNRRLERRGWAQ